MTGRMQENVILTLLHQMLYRGNVQFDAQNAECHRCVCVCVCTCAHTRLGCPSLNSDLLQVTVGI